MTLTTELHITRNPRARRLILRLAVQGDGIEVVAPRRVSLREINRFVDRNRDWIDEHLASRPPHVPFAHGTTIPVAGVPHRIELASATRGTMACASGVLSVPSLPEHLPRRVRDYLMREARTALTACITRQAKALGVSVPSMTLRDTTTRWGSCSPSGKLSFSWRLILAPPSILDYVAAHEMAHLKHMNHGPDFWALCEDLAPQTPEARNWLKRNGATLHRYG